MADPVPTHQDALVLLELYQLSNEPHMREARQFVDRVIAKKLSQLGEEESGVEWYRREIPPGSREDAQFRQVLGFWNMVGALVKTGCLHPEVLFESTSEFYRLWKAVAPLAEKLRESCDPLYLANLEWLAKEYEDYREKRQRHL